MFEIAVSLLESTVRKAHFTAMNIDKVYEYLSVDGHLTVLHDSKTVFSEDIAAAEFYWYILKWYRSGGIKHRSPFEYATIEHSEPILTFSHYRENQEKMWKIDSPWMKDNASVIVEEQELESQVQKLICYLAEKLEL